MSAVLTRGEFGNAICKIFGLERVVWFNINTPSDGVVTAEVEFCLDEIQCGKVVSLLKEYEIHEKPAGDWIDDQAEKIKEDIKESACAAMRSIENIHNEAMDSIYPSYAYARRGDFFVHRSRLAPLSAYRCGGLTG